MSNRAIEERAGPRSHPTRMAAPAREVATPTALPAYAGVQRLQRTLGNAQVQTLLQRCPGCGGTCGCGGKKKEEDGVAAGIQLARGGGRPMEDGLRQEMEGSFGADFQSVRLHTDDRADALNRALGARAFTTGRDVFFRQGEYLPGSVGGRELIAHELTHVLQQRGSTVQGKLVVGPADDVYEREADQVARQVARAERAPAVHAVGAGMAPVQRQLLAPPPQAGGFRRPMERDLRETYFAPRWAPTTTLRTVQVWFNAFIPSHVPGQTSTVPAGPHAGGSMLAGPTPISDCFLTDNRGFDSTPGVSSRVRSQVEIDVGTLRLRQSNVVDPTVELDCEDGEVECDRSAGFRGDGFHNVRVRSASVVSIGYTAAAANGCVPGSPDIDVSLTVTLDANSRTLSVSGMIEPYPAFEMYASADGGAAVTLFRRGPVAGATPTDLFGPPNQVVSATVAL